MPSCTLLYAGCGLHFCGNRIKKLIGKMWVYSQKFCLGFLLIQYTNCVRNGFQSNFWFKNAAWLQCTVFYACVKDKDSVFFAPTTPFPLNNSTTRLCTVFGGMNHVSNEQIRYCLNFIVSQIVALASHQHNHPHCHRCRFIRAIHIFDYGKNVFEVRKEI